MLAMIALTIAAIAIVMFAMAIGVVMKRPCLRGSCGGPAILDPDGDPLSCGTCPNRNKSEQTPAA